MARIYSRGGDRGETSLADGSRTSKSGPRVDLYGEMDELISTVGYCAALLGQGNSSESRPLPPIISTLERDLVGIQNRLFTLASILADPRQTEDESLSGPAVRSLGAGHLEQLIDAMDVHLPPLANFILPGGDPSSAALHVARTVCRRIERKAVALGAVESIPRSSLIYLNRLSDFLFTAARAVNHAAGRPDEQWNQDEGAGD